MAEATSPHKENDWQRNLTRSLTSISSLGWNRPGYTFKGWNTNPSATTATYSDGSPCSFPSDINLYAVWKLDNWTITYDMNGHGTCPAGVKTSYNASTLLTDYFPPAAENIFENGDLTYSFLNWEPPYLPVGSTGDKTFTANWLQVNSENPGFKTVAILDTSGTMETVDYKKSAVAISETLRNYVKTNSKYAKLQIFYGTFLDNVSENTSDFIQNFDVKDNQYSTDMDLAQAIYDDINGLNKTGDSEAMVTCLYYAISRTMQEIDKNISNNVYSIGSIPTKAINFLLLTDERVFRGGKLSDDGNYYIINGVSSFAQYYNLIFSGSWFWNWQTHTFGTFEADYEGKIIKKPSASASPNWNSRFPVPNLTEQISKTLYDNYAYRVDDITYGNMYPTIAIPSNDKAKKAAELITHALKQISYYYGVSLTWGIYYGMAPAGYDQRISCANPSATYKAIPTINEVPTKSTIPSDESVGWNTNGSTFRYYKGNNTNNIWKLPDGCHVSDVTEVMTTITYFNCDFTDDRVMVADDKYNETNVTTKVHHVNGRYFQFKFMSDQLTLPSTGHITQKDGKTLSQWKLIIPSGSITYSPGNTMTMSSSMFLTESLICFQAVYA